MRYLLACIVAGSLLGADAGTPLVSEMNAIAQKQLKARADTIAAIRDVRAAERRKTEVRAKILSLIGGLPDYKGPLNAKITGTLQRPGYVIEKVLFESLPNYWVTANLYRPERAGKHPAVLMSMGHWETGKAAAQVLSANLARKGFVVLAYDPTGQGERQQAFDPRWGRSLIRRRHRSALQQWRGRDPDGSGGEPLLHSRRHACYRLPGEPS